MEQKKGFVRVYVIIAIFYGLLGLADGLLVLFSTPGKVYVSILSLVALFFFLFNIIALAWFHHHHVHSIAHYFPLYHIISYGFFQVTGLWISLGNNVGMEGILVFLGTGLSFLEILFGFYLLARLGLISAAPATMLRTYHSEEREF